MTKENKKHTPVFLAFAVFLGLTACENEIRFDLDDRQRLLVLNSLLMPDSLIDVSLTESKLLTEYVPDGFRPVDDAVVQLYVDGTLREALTHAGDGRYVSTVRPALGQEITLAAVSEQMGGVRATTPVRRPVPIDEVGISNVREEIYYDVREDDGYEGVGGDTVGYDVEMKYDLSITFTDPAGEENYYRLLLAKKRDTLSYTQWEEVPYDLNDVFNPSTMDEIMDVGSSEHFYKEFADDRFDGQTFTLRIPMSEWHYVDLQEEEGGYNAEDEDRGHPTVRIDLQAISYDFYRYLQTRGKIDNGSVLDDLFAEPTQMYSNVKGGVGILGSYTPNVEYLEVDVWDRRAGEIGKMCRSL